MVAMNEADEERLRRARHACRTWSRIKPLMLTLDTDGRVAEHNAAMESLGESVWLEQEPTMRVLPEIRR